MIRRRLPKLNFVGRGLNRLYHRRMNTRSFNTAGIDVFLEDWDNLLILDACRFDLFAAEQTLDGDLSKCVSRGSTTKEFLYGNCSGKRLHDTVYVTANPQLHRNRDWITVEFHATTNVWDTDDWDDELGTARPITVCDYVRRAQERYPDKRLVAHFMQPHYPFVDAEFDSGDVLDTETVFFWHDLMLGNRTLDPEEVWRAYSENLRWVLPTIDELLGDLVGKTVITSDHGNMIGERAAPVPSVEWGHPPGVYTSELVEVPWLVIESEERKAITASPPTEETHSPGEDVEKRLKQLGYRT